LSIFGGPAWTWHPTRQQWYLRHFLSEQPDLNFRSQAVQEEINVYNNNDNTNNLLILLKLYVTK
jgi:glycosidase